MHSKPKAFLALALLAQGLPAFATWRESAYAGLVHYGTEPLVHPKRHQIKAFVEDEADFGAEICLRYSRSSDRPDQGQIKTTIEIRRPDGFSVDPAVVDRHKLKKIKVRSDAGWSCDVVDTELQKGDQIVAAVRFQRMPELQREPSTSTGLIALELSVQAAYPTESWAAVSGGIPAPGSSTRSVGLSVDYNCDQPDGCGLWGRLLDRRGRGFEGTSTVVGATGKQTVFLRCSPGLRHGVEVEIQRLNGTPLASNRVPVAFTCE